ncbi:MAG: hypothetical protein B7X86_02935 [Sphingobacteriales bacterium 17-39-43]|uniref:hypothetical protein n=1 Tax=Daejeonella sp. TaxID=2805397 RepID=UPI000BDBE0D2|nr:hypothetical protein [Daejeonella sp.]OYZ33286.1 MAG: hypothetical protein B7Y24_02935 [Sphingobacteriales bacterium 16-39-50]OZA26695.1 MAG: hypothetical protein B7X86_02935 [Sphingobacteriales bacterium 17-39-43]HQT22299.1 hypothetical protein [Daejeonella sp.]HQT56860.1 hypothetical protein [Daejeonella sp.]
MTYQHKISLHRSLNGEIANSKFAIVLLSILLLNAITVTFYFYSLTLFSLSLFLSIIFFILLLRQLRKTHKVSFIEISNKTLNYFDTDSEEIVKVMAQDITHISTKLCELRIHTNERVHLVNLNVIRNDKKRWEIKEKIRTLCK